MRPNSVPPSAGFILALAVLVIGSLTAFPVLAAGKAKAPEAPAMSFIVVKADNCAADCPEWISAEGDIRRETTDKLKKLLKKLGKRKLPIVLTSNGGDLDAAYAMGRLIRKNGLDVSIGTTRLVNCPYPVDPRCKAAISKEGAAQGTSHSSGGYCASACPMMFAGGVRRFSAPWVQLGVHQVTTIIQNYRIKYEIQYKMVKGKKKEVSRKEVGRKYGKQQTTTTLSKKARGQMTAYLKEMGVGSELIPMVESAPPDKLRYVTPTEAVSLGLVTTMLKATERPIEALCAMAGGPEVSRCGLKPPLQSVSAEPQASAATVPVRN